MKCLLTAIAKVVDHGINTILLSDPNKKKVNLSAAHDLVDSSTNQQTVISTQKNSYLSHYVDLCTETRVLFFKENLNLILKAE